MEPGVEFVVSFAAEPVLFVIKRQYREDVQSATQQAFYYVLHGSVYQAPALHACLHARTDRCLHHLDAAFTRLKRDLEPHSWQEERRKRLKRSAEVPPARSVATPGTEKDGEECARRSEAVAEANAAVQQAAMTPHRWARIKQGDTIIMNVLGRCA